MTRDEPRSAQDVIRDFLDEPDLVRVEAWTDCLNIGTGPRGQGFILEPVGAVQAGADLAKALDNKVAQGDRLFFYRVKERSPDAC